MFIQLLVTMNDDSLSYDLVNNNKGSNNEFSVAAAGHKSGTL